MTIKFLQSLAFVCLLCLAILSPGSLSAQTPQLGPVLYLIQASASQVRQLANTGLTVHTALLGAPDQYIASGDQAAASAAAALGVGVRILDPSTQGRVYFFAEADQPDAIALVSGFGPILYQDSTELFVGIPQEREGEFVQQVPAQGVEVSGLPLTPYVPPPEIVTALALPTQADPLIQSLVRSVSSDSINNRMADLSGARPVNLNGTNVTLSTLYTYSPIIRSAEQYLFNAYQQLGYSPIYVPWSRSGASGKTIVAELPGVLHPERIWIVDGHFDTTSQNPMVSAPGADDNASGVALTLVLAERLKGQRFADTIRFVNFSGEEQGMLASKVYAAQLKAAGVQLMGVIDLDQLGYDSNNDRVFEIHSGTRASSLELAKMFIAANALYGQGLVIELKDTTAARWSDHSSFWDQGFAAILAEENWFTDARPPDGTPCYHKTCDTLATLNLDYIHRAARTTLATISHLAGIITGPTPTPTMTATPSNTPTASLTPTPSSTPTATATPGPMTCVELVSNGGFEQPGTWLFGTTARRPIYVTSPVHSGTQALQMGIPSGGANATAHSSARHLMTFPASAESITLKYWERPGGGDGTDYRELLLLNSSGGLFRTLDRNFGTGTNQWQIRSFDLTPYRGQTVYLYLNTYNNGAGGLTWNYVDDVSVQACNTTTPSPITTTPTQTPTDRMSPTITPSSTASATPSATTTSTLTSSPSTSPTGTATQTIIPTFTPTATAPWTLTATTTATTTATPTPTMTATVSSTPTATLTLTATSTPTSGTCIELVANGGFENDSSWTFGATSRPAGYVTTPVHGGARALRLGILPGTPNANSYSSARQLVVLPSQATNLTLAYWERPGGGDASDYRETLILDARGRPRTLARSFGSGNNEWQLRSFDLTAFRGQTVTLYFNTYNSGGGSLAWDNIDDASVLACGNSP